MISVNKSSVVIEPYFIQEGRPLKDFIYLDDLNSGVSKDKSKWSERFFYLHNETTKPIEINKNGFRCDEFKNKHNGTHILFMGCSVTWGTGLYFNETWSSKLYYKFLEDFDLSGYFNIGIPGDSIFAQVVTAFKYFKNYGNPDIIFFNIPEIRRFYAYSEKDKSLVGSGVLKDKNDILNLLSYQYYYMLEQYCLSHGIKILSFTYAEDQFNLDKSKIKDFNTFYSIDKQDMIDHVNIYSKKNLEDEFSITARDGIHFGTAYSDYWSKFMYEKYKELIVV